MNDEFLWRSELRGLQTDQTPSRDLWPDIAARLTAPPRRHRWRAAAALAACAVAAFGAVASLAWHRDAVSPVSAPMAHVAPPPSADAALAWVEPRDAGLAAAARQLDQANADLQAALEARPDATFLVGLINRTQMQRMRLLRQELAQAPDPASI